MARFLEEPAHKYGIAFVRPNHHELLMMEVYMKDLDEDLDIGVKEKSNVELGKTDGAGLETKEEEIDQAEK